jgi:hypothetical protein
MDMAAVSAPAKAARVAGLAQEGLDEGGKARVLAVVEVVGLGRGEEDLLDPLLARGGGRARRSGRG